MFFCNWLFGVSTGCNSIIFCAQLQLDIENEKISVRNIIPHLIFSYEPIHSFKSLIDFNDFCRYFFIICLTNNIVYSFCYPNTI